jgi:hypothetical protein
MADDKQLRFHYIKSASYRVVHVDGAHGGITPQGGIFAGIFSERLPIPLSVVHALKDDGSLGDEIMAERKSRDGVVREVEVGLEMNLHIAEQIHEWLGKKIEQLKALQTAAKAKPHE